MDDARRQSSSSDEEPRVAHHAVLGPDREPFDVPATIDDPVILDEVREALRTLGYAGAVSLSDRLT